MRGNCEFCGKWADLDTHHIFNGAYRKKSEQYGATARICRECHNLVHSNWQMRYATKVKYQEKIQRDYGLTEEEFIRLFGKNYKFTEE